MDAARPVIIVNPRSGGGISTRTWAGLVARITDELGPFDFRFTEHRGHAREIARDEALAGRPLVVAFGGDGTISEVACGIITAGGNTEMGILPRGTGGDFRRTIDVPKDLAKAARRLKEARTRVIDAGRATCIGPDGATRTTHFLNVASFGFSADVAQRANVASKRLGARAAFLGATMKSLLAYDNAEVVVSVDGGEPRRRTVLLGAIGNGRFFGGGMKICPDGFLDDGLLDLVTVGDLGRLEILAKINRLYAGTHVSMREVEVIRARRIVVQPVAGDREIPVETDGETPGRLPATFEVLPRALRLRF